jgi:3',5'-cyclic AMP phosphodiesterase CpdA
MATITRRLAFQQLAAGLAMPTVWHSVAEARQTTAAKIDPYADAVFIPGPPPKCADGSFTIAVLPDTQNYSEKYPEIFKAQTRWIVEQKKPRNIAAVLHLGDITNRNTLPEWENARQAMQQLDGEVPYFLCPGNHDYSAGGVCKDRTTHLNDYFQIKEHQSRPTFGGVYPAEPDRLENSFHKFSVGDRHFLVIALEFGPRQEVVTWANEVAAQHPKHEAILITHAYMYSDDTRYDWKYFGTHQTWNPHSYAVAKATNDNVTDGEELWHQLVAKHPNFILAINGHVLNDGLARTVSTTPHGRDIPQVLVNFQMKPNGGDGWLRLLEFQPDRRTVEIWDYSPTRNQCNISGQNRFRMRLAPVA